MSVAITTRPRALPWVGMGATVSTSNYNEALFEAGLDYEVEQTYAYDNRGNEVPGILVNRNVNTCEILGVTSEAYGVVQNHEAFSLLDPFCQAGGIIEHAGMTETGMVFMVMRVPGMAFGFKDDDFELFVCAMNSFNTKFPLALIITPVRVICQNMFRKLMARGDTALLIKHGRFAADRIMSATKATSTLLDYEQHFLGELREDYSKERKPVQVHEFIEDLLPLVPVTPEHPNAVASNRRIEASRTEFMDYYYLAPDNEKYVGTKLGILNAYYDWITHHTPSRARANSEATRFGNLMNGTGVNRKLIISA